MVAAVLLIAGGVLTRSQAEIAHQLPRVSEAAEVTDLGEQAQGGVGGDTPEGAKPGDRIGPRLALGNLRQFVIEGGELGVEAIEVGAHLLQRKLGEGIVEALAIEPFAVLDGPGLLALAVDMAVAQERLGDAVAGCGAGATQIVSAADQVTQPLLRRGGRRHEEELPCAVEPHQLLGVAAVGLYPVSGADRYQRGRDHVAGHPDPAQEPKEVIAAGPRLIGDRQCARLTCPIDEAAD